MVENFSQSIFYPAGGTDLQVLLRFSDLSDTVISPTLSMHLIPPMYDSVFRQKCEHLNRYFGEKVLEYRGYEVLSSNFIEANKFIPFPEDVLSKSEREEYVEVFRNFYNQENFVLKYSFDRYIGPIKRRVHWIAMNTEGIATFMALVQLSKKHPKIICTIQSGVFEYPNSMMVKLLKKLNLRTKVWVRGFWDDGFYYTYDNRPITPFPPYTYAVQDYGHWYSNLGQRRVSNEENDTSSQLTRVRAFTKDPNFTVPSVTEVKGQGSGRAILMREDIRSADLSAYDMVFTSKRLIPNDASGKVVYWDALSTRPTHEHYPDLTFVESLSVVKEMAQREGLRKVALTAVGYEDETLYLKSILDETSLDLELHFYYKQPLDFIMLTKPEVFES